MKSNSEYSPGKSPTGTNFFKKEIICFVNGTELAPPLLLFTRTQNTHKKLFLNDLNYSETNK